MIDILPWQETVLHDLLARRSQLPHALLIQGRAGVGKREFARALAQSLLCEQVDAGVACGVCAACNWFRDGNHPDFREIIPEALTEDGDEEAVAIESDAKEKKKSKEIKIEQIRAISDFMSLSTHRDGFRVLIVHPAEAMNAAAANALLKTLEEPPARTAILMVSDGIGRLLATIRSRCQRVQIPMPDEAAAEKWLHAQGVSEPMEALSEAGGAPLDALRFADATYQTERRDFVRALATRDADYLATAQAFEKSDLLNVIHWLQTWVNDLVLSRHTGEVRCHRKHKAAISRLAMSANVGLLYRYESALRQARRAIHHPLNPRLLLEHLLISYGNAIRPESAAPAQPAP